MSRGIGRACLPVAGLPLAAASDVSAQEYTSGLGAAHLGIAGSPPGDWVRINVRFDPGCRS
jgi:hypothetical protein